MRTLVRFAGALLALACAQGAAEDIARGKLIYETRCIACHDRSVHARNPHSAGSCEEIRDYVERWSRQTGSGWSDEEVEDVTAYLNQRYYHFPLRDRKCIRSVAAAGYPRPAPGITASGSARPTTR